MERSLLTTKEVADALGVSSARIRQMVLSGLLPSEKVGRDVLIPAAAVDVAKERKTKPGPTAKPKDGETAANEGETTAAEKPTKKKKAKAVDQKKAAKLSQTLLADWKREPTKPTKKSKK